MASWLRIRGENLKLTKADNTPSELKVTYPDREYRMFSLDISDEDLLAFWRYRYGLDAPDPYEVVETGGGILAGPVPNGRET